MERLQKVIARAGVASRRAAEELIRQGRVTVNGVLVTRLGTRVDSSRDRVEIDGRTIPAPPARHTYVVLNKPRGYVTTASDPEGRPKVTDLIRGQGTRLFPVGRLDFQSEGLLLLTDDGDLARDLMRPASAVPKTYVAKVRGTPSPASLERLRGGRVAVRGRAALPAQVRIVRSAGDKSWVEITVVEGRKHQVRTMLESVGHPVLRLRRTRYGGVELGRLPAGRYRPLTPAEVTVLRRSTETPSRPMPRRHRGFFSGTA